VNGEWSMNEKRKVKNEKLSQWRWRIVNS